MSKNLINSELAWCSRKNAQVNLIVELNFIVR